jgi:hypothetical protein
MQIDRIAFSPETARAEVDRVSARVEVLEDGHARAKAIVAVAARTGHTTAVVQMKALLADLDTRRKTTPV